MGSAKSAKLSSRWQRNIGRWTRASNWQSLIKHKATINTKRRLTICGHGGSNQIRERWWRNKKDKIFAPYLLPFASLKTLCLSLLLLLPPSSTSIHQWHLLLSSNPPLFSISSSGLRASPSASPPSPSSAATPPPPLPPSPSVLALTTMSWSKQP